ncbi:hypothetical protein KEF29_12685 [Streptomyces tuirus]|uniref:Uncharacterized protein n=1 Tax=Streptomyces tuirus TaxID=68278 RepID=A0A941FGF7_9ACTN|nr:hypothetical protein [Streptomyces tuirus]
MLTAHFTLTHWWIAAIVTGLALAVAVQLFILGALPLAVLRLVFAGWFRRRLALKRSGSRWKT